MKTDPWGDDGKWAELAEEVVMAAHGRDLVSTWRARVVTRTAAAPYLHQTLERLAAHLAGIR